MSPYTSGIMEPGPNVTNYVVQQQSAHSTCPSTLTVASDPVAETLLNALDPSTPRPVPCTVVLPLLGAPAYTGPPR